MSKIKTVRHPNNRLKTTPTECRKTSRISDKSSNGDRKNYISNTCYIKSICVDPDDMNSSPDRERQSYSYF